MSTLHTAPSPFHGVADVPGWTLGDRMSKALRHAQISAVDMAIDLDVSTATISRWLNDKGPVKRHILRLWALTCGVSLEWLETGQAPTAAEQSGPGSLPRLDSNQQPSGYVFPLVRARLVLAA